MAESPWPVIAQERGALADDLSTISDAQWQTQSQCTGWTVHDLLAHMLATARMTKGGFFAEYSAIDEKNVAPIPKGLSLEEAGALAVSGITWVMNCCACS